MVIPRMSVLAHKVAVRYGMCLSLAFMAAQTCAAATPQAATNQPATIQPAGRLFRARQRPQNLASHQESAAARLIGQAGYVALQRARHQPR